MTTDQIILYILFPVGGYLLGSVPFAWLIGKASGVDIRTVGSKNVGATNLGRTLGKRFFWYAFLLDAAKGFLPVLLAAFLARHWNATHSGWTFYTPYSTSTPDPLFPAWTPLLTAIACVLGHNFPIWLKFKGGKGVATSLGVVLGFWPLYTMGGVVGGLTFIFMLLVYRYISLASMVAAVAFATTVTVLSQKNLPFVHTELAPGDLAPMIGIAWLFTALIIFRHRANISRLLNGTEPPVGKKQIDKAKMEGETR